VTVPVDSLLNLPSGTDVLLDANILIYALGGRSQQCLGLLNRCAVEDVTGITTIEVVGDVCHRLMLAEAFATGAITKETAKQLKARPQVISGLTKYWTQTEGIFDLNLLVLALEESRLRTQGTRALYGLLTKDSLIVAAAQDLGIECLASNDPDFERVPWLTLYKPSDV
jgi:predicted nucleic acid-binding protein